MRINRIHVSLITGAIAAAALGACKKGSEYASDTSTMKVDSAAGRAETTTAAAVRTDSGTPPGKFADASVLGFATVANNGEIAMGKLGEHMATNPAVKSFSRTLVTDHEKLLAGTKQLATKLATSPDTTAGDAMDLMNHDADEIKDLNGKAKGADWDKEFMNQVIDGHQRILSQLQDAAKNSPSESVRTALEQASGVIQQHLTKAQDIKTTILKD